MIIPDAERSLFREGDVDLARELLSEKWARRGFESGEVLHHGTYEEDGPVTWEVLVFPRVIRSDGEPDYSSPKLARLQAHVSVAE